jgi:hypothetical protein
MGKLIEQSIKTLYQGVSRQPDPVRLPGQVQEAENILVSVVTGGFESRPASRHVSSMPHIVDADTPAIYAYSRDAIEQYLITINNTDLKVFDLAGVEKTVAFPNGKTYLTATDAEDSFSFVTIADYTVIANKTTTVTMLASSYVPQYRGLINCRTTNSSTTYTIKLTTGGVTTTIYTNAVTTALSNTALATAIIGGLSLPAGITAAQNGETIVLTGTAVFTLEHTGTDQTYGPWAMTDSVPDRKYLPLNAPADYPIRVGSNIDGELIGYWAKFDSYEGGWIEAADPHAANFFNPSTMPHVLVREADGSFTFKENEWEGRKAGDVDTVKPPDFVDNKITALAFHRNRLVFVSGETVFMSQSSQYFTFWPDFSTQSLDSDAFGLVASSSSVNDLKHAVGFRKSLFLTSNKAQFEVSGDATFTPSNATVDLSTSYLTEDSCEPITLGNTLYFAAKSGRDAIVFEYQYDDNSVSNIAQDVTLHALGYIPAPLVRMTGDSTNDMIMLLSKTDRSALYIYKMYVDGETKAQSAWSKWTYGTSSKIKWMAVIDGEMYMVLSRNGVVVFEKTFLRYELSDEKHPYQISMDRQTTATGVYTSVNNLTTWTAPYAHTDLTRVVLSTDFPAGQVGEVLNVSYPTTTTVTAAGDYTGGQVILGETYTSSVTLSKLFPRDSNNQKLTLTGGRFQIRNIVCNYKETGFFRCEVTPEFRTPDVYTFNGRVVGSGDSKVGVAAISALGGFRVPIKSDGKTVGIRIFNNSEKPMNITSIDYVGFFNEVTRQG